MVGVDLESQVKRRSADVVRAIEESGAAISTRRKAEPHGGRRQIDSMEKGSHQPRMLTCGLQWFAIPALIALAAAVGLRAVPYFVDQT